MENAHHAAKAFSKQHGITEVEAEDVLTALELDVGDLAYVAAHPDRTASFDVPGSTDRRAGQAGWVVWFDEHDTALAVTNGDPVHGEELRSLAAAVQWAYEYSRPEIINLNPATPVKTAHLGDATLQRGYVYSCQKTGEEPEMEDGGSFGFHGDASTLPPCAAEYLCDDGDCGYLVISAESEADAIETVDGWSLAPAKLEAGQLIDDGTWSVVVVKCHGGHRFTVAGTL